MLPAVTASTQHHQVGEFIIPKFASRLQMMNLQVLQRNTDLAPPAVPFEHSDVGARHILFDRASIGAAVDAISPSTPFSFFSKLANDNKETSWRSSNHVPEDLRFAVVKGCTCQKVSADHL